MVVRNNFIEVVKRPPTEPGDVVLSTWAETVVSASVLNADQVIDFSHHVAGGVIDAMELFDPDMADCLMGPLHEKFKELVADPSLQVEFQKASYDAIEEYSYANVDNEMELNT